MNDDRRRSNEWDALWAAWPGAEPRAGFADRVLAACDAPPRLRVVPPASRESPAGARGALVLCAAVAAALMLLPFVLHRHAPPARASVAAAADASDLGLAHD